MDDGPTYPHDCVLCQFQGVLQLNGQTLDCYICCRGGTILFRYGPEPYSYWANPTSSFPLKGRKEGRGENHHVTRITVINAAFEAARKMGFV